MGVTLLHENERLRISEMYLAPATSISSRNAIPSIYWEVAQPGQATPQPAFYSAGSEARLENTSSEHAHFIFFELLGMPKYTEEQVQKLLDAAVWPTEVGSALLLENHLCRLWDFRSSLGMHCEDIHQHCLDNAFVVLGPSRLNLYSVDASGKPIFERQVELHDRQVVWTEIKNGGFSEDGQTLLSPQCLHSVDNAADSEFREFLIELK